MPERRTRTSSFVGSRVRRRPEDDPGELLNAIVTAHGEALMSFALHLTSDRQRAEDVVQETLLRAWRHPEALDGTKGSPRAWLFRVAQHQVVDLWRQDSRRQKTEGARSEADKDHQLTERLDRLVDDWILSAALQKLSREHREVLLHTVWLDRSVDETAQVLGIPPGTVKSRTYYALRALRLFLEELRYFS